MPVTIRVFAQLMFKQHDSYARLSGILQRPLARECAARGSL
jgi:hypothetical protein